MDIARSGGTMLNYIPEIYPDELLYSVVARLGCHSGNLSPKLLLDDVFSNRNVRAGVFLQTNIGRMATNIPSTCGLTAQRLARETTLIPYITAYQPQEVRDWALAALTGDDGDAEALHIRLGLVASNVRLPSALRYCPTCRAEMLARHGELYWRRDHQLPGVLLCPTHGSPLADSHVILARARQHEFIAADEDNCPPEPIPPSWAAQVEAVKLLQNIAKCSAALLTTPPPACRLAVWGKEYRLALRSRGFDRGNAHIDQPALLDAFLTRFGPILEILPNAKPDYWLESITRKHRKSFAPFHHILIRLLIESLPLTEAKSPFGPGPWLCRNPLAEHRGQSVVVDCIQHKDGGKTIGVFHCSCGYAFSTAPEPGSRAKILNLGPQFNARLRELVTTGNNLRRTAKVLHVDPNTVLRYVTLLGLQTPWKARPTHAKLPSIDREAMRVAWTDGRTAAPDLTRHQLRSTIPAVYAWLYRNDRDWLNVQSPVAISPIVNKPRFDWSAVDAKTAETLQEEAAQLRSQTPPQQITRKALERILGQDGWLEKRLHKLPRCVTTLPEVTESVNDFRCRRIVWAAAELQQQEQPFRVWRLRRLAGLPDHCAPIVESCLRKAVHDI
jgi:hypothetical protein